VAGLFGSLQDITERKQGAERQRRLEAQLQQAQKMESLGILVAGVAHNINNVLSVIMGTASLREGVVTEPSDLEAYQIIGKVCRRGRDVMKSLIRFAKPGLTLQAPFELHALIQEVCALLAKTTGDRVKIVVALSEAPIWIDGDAGSINHVLVNLCINAMEAMPNGGILTLRTAIPEEGWAEVAIEDNGTGMAPEVLAHVLEPFYTTKEVGKGTGLGLSMTYGVVTAHGGTIDIASQPGQGTTVALRFPRIPAPARLEGEGSSGDQVPFSPGALRIFLVDDDEDVRFLMTRLLKKAGVPHVETFTGGEAVLQRLRSGELPDLIILDQNMPEMNGAQAMARIRALRPEMPILVSSGQPDIETLESFRQARVAVISKPFSLEEIQAKLAQFAHETFRDAAEGTEGAV